MICFDGGKWLSDFIEAEEGQTQKEALDSYMTQYEQVRSGMEIVSKLLPGIIHISVMGE
jgi:hypothetical protein